MMMLPLIYCLGGKRNEDKIINKNLKTIGNSPIKSGGILGIKGDVICAYYFDKISNHKISIYYPNYPKLNKIIRKWAKLGINFVGMVHSHPNSYNKPSLADYDYAKKILENNDFLEKLIFPIVTFEKKAKITFYELQHKFIEIEVII